MIDKSGEYWHLYFDESCDDSPWQILALVRKLFAEIAEMGDVCYMRVKPEIERHGVFDDVSFITVRCRFSAKPAIQMEGTLAVGLAASVLNIATTPAVSDSKEYPSYCQLCGRVVPCGCPAHPK
jgi:hypothetical protein